MKAIAIILVVLILTAPLTAGERTRSSKPIRFALSVTVAGLGIADTALTIYGTNRGLVETNAILRPLIEKHQYAALWSIQALGTAIIIASCNLLASQRDLWPRLVGYALFAAVIITRSLVVIHNARLNRGL
jgi:hypothetical protein